MFNIDFRQIVYNILPHFLRKPGILAYLYSAVKPLKDLNTTFTTFRTTTNYNLSFTGQTIYLKHFLNDQHDPVGRGIYITNINNDPYNYLFNVIEGAPLQYVYNTAEGNPYYLNNFSEVLAGNDFTIFVPAALVYNSIDLNEDVKNYAQAGVTWNIQTY